MPATVDCPPINLPPTASNVLITGTPEVGQVLTGSYTYADAEDDLEGASTFRWLRDGRPIAGATERTYTLVAADQGTLVSFEVTPVAQTGMSPGIAVVGPPVGPVGPATPAPNDPPVASAVGITGTPEVGQVLTGGFTYSDAEGDLEGASTFRWLRNGTPIAGATAQRYTLVAADQGATVSFEVTPVAQRGTSPGLAVRSAAVGPITAPPNDPPVASDVRITGTPQVGQVLTGGFAYSDTEGDPEGASTFRWLRDGTPIAGATAQRYNLVAGDQGATVSFEVTPVAQRGTTPGRPVRSGAVGPVTAPINEPPVASRVLISGTAQVGQVLTGSFAYADRENDPQGASTFRWLRGTTPIAGATARTYTLVAADQGATVSFEVTPVAQRGTSPGLAARSAAAGPVAAPPNAPPTASRVLI
ncbi:MAG: hypothetical protein ACREXK_14305, partial [Gammaproteobacteria bacterium]